MEIFSFDIFAALVTLTALEIILGFDNLVIIAILTEKLPPLRRPAARRLGLALALITRVMLLSIAFFTAQLSQPFATVAGFAISARDLLLLAGGAFLIIKGYAEIHHKIIGTPEFERKHKHYDTLLLVALQIALMDIVLSFDTVMTAIGLARDLWVMILAICIAMAAMVLAINVISDFIGRHPRIKTLALCYMLLIGAALIAQAFHIQVSNTYLYSAIAFSCFVELVQTAAARKPKHDAENLTAE